MRRACIDAEEDTPEERWGEGVVWGSGWGEGYAENVSTERRILSMSND